MAKAWAVDPGETIGDGIIVGPQAYLVSEPFESVIDFLSIVGERCPLRRM